MKPRTSMLMIETILFFMALAGSTQVAVLLLALAGVPKASAQGFSFIPIDVPNAIATGARGVASDGTVVGFYLDQSLTAHGFLRSPNGMLTFPIDYENASVAVVGTVVNRIDPQGENLVGWWIDSASLLHGLVINLSSKVAISFDFPNSLGVLDAINGVNRSGEISGAYSDTAGNGHGFTANVGCFSLPTCYQTLDFPGGLDTELGGINDNGDIVGDYVAANSKVTSFLFSGGTFTALSAPSASVVSARGINNSRQIVGSYGNAFPFFEASLQGLSGLFIAPGALHGFLLSPTERFTPVNFRGADAQNTGIGAINDSGTIVGHYNSPGFVSHGFVAIPTN